MAISTGNTATASDMTSLLAAVKTLFSNRGLTVNNQTLSTMLTSYNPTFSAGASMAMNYGGDLFNKILIVNNIGNLKYSASGHRVLADGTTTEVLNWVNTYKDKTGTDAAHGCRGACVGICTGGCALTADAQGPHSTQSGSNVYNGQVDDEPGRADGDQDPLVCSGHCNTLCYTSCRTGCNGTCTDSCSGCDSNCNRNCSTGCNGGCKGCNSSCTGNCKTGCTSCHNGCSSGCQNECTNTCATDCNTTCYTTCTGTSTV